MENLLYIYFTLLCQPFFTSIYTFPFSLEKVFSELNEILCQMKYTELDLWNIYFWKSS